jgi:hypothetical protein
VCAGSAAECPVKSPMGPSALFVTVVSFPK